MGLGVEGPEVLDQPNPAVLLAHGEDRAVELAPGWLDNSHLEPLSHVFLNLLPVRIRNLELLHVDRLI